MVIMSSNSYMTNSDCKKSCHKQMMEFGKSHTEKETLNFGKICMSACDKQPSK